MGAFVYLLVVMAQIADLGTSLIGFRHGAIELNPLGQTPGRLVALKVLAVAVVVSALYVSGRLHTRWVWPVVAAAAIFASGLVYMAAWRNLGL